MLAFGWIINDEREGAWIEDDAFGDIPPEVQAEYMKDGDASHLLPYAKHGKPTIFKFKALNGDQLRFAKTMIDGTESASRFFAMCFRLGVEFGADGGEDFRVDLPTGQKITGLQRTVKVRGVRLLAQEFVDSLDRRYPDFVDFYGALIWKASQPSEQEKKASSPPSTPTKSMSDTVEAAKTDDPQGA